MKSSIIPATDVVLNQVPVAVISPDGKRLVYGGFKGGTYMLWVQALDVGVAQPLVEADARARWIGWSADSRFVFFQDPISRLRKVDVGGGGSDALAPVRLLVGVTSNAAGDVLFTPDNNRS